MISPESGESRATSRQVVEELSEPEKKRMSPLRGTLRVLLATVTDARFGIGGNYDVLRCTVCGLEQTHPVPSPDELNYQMSRHSLKNSAADTRLGFSDQLHGGVRLRWSNREIVSPELDPGH